MTAPYPQLPFPRGKTYSQGVYTPTAEDGAHLEGKRFTVPDERNPGGEKVLMVVRNGGTNVTVANKVVRFATLGTKAVDGAYTGTAGAIGKPIDDAYPAGTVIKAHDLFYVVDEGVVQVTKTTGSGSGSGSGSGTGDNIAAGAKVYANADGVIDNTVSTGYVVGAAYATGAYDATSMLVMVGPGLGR